jgi:phosphate starvation-inducible PhoH-like protein
MVARRKFKEIPEEDIQELHDFLEQDNKQEVVTVSTINVNIKCKTENQKKLINSIKQNEITICSGLPGTGKTFLSCAQALKLIKGFAKFKRIVLIKSVTTLKNEEIGFLKGTLEEKMEPYVDSFMDNFRKLIGKTRTLKLRSLGIIEVLPIAFARGRSIDNSIIIIDEAQNISLDNIRTLMTRIGDNSKMVILGDVKQKDIRNKKDSSLEVVLEKFKDVEGFGCVELRNTDDVVRNPIIKTIEEVFENLEG